MKGQLTSLCFVRSYSKVYQGHTIMNSRSLGMSSDKPRPEIRTSSSTKERSITNGFEQAVSP